MIAGIIGATGYAGAELVRILSGHPRIDSLVFSSSSYEGSRIEDIYPNFLDCVSGKLEKAEDVIAAADLVFSALPHGVGEAYAKACMDKGISFIDLSADFRFDDDEETYAAWYGKSYAHPELRGRSVYGLPELNREKIKALSAEGPLIIGNPGCYPTGISLGLFPLLAGEAAGSRAVITDGRTIIADGCTIIADAASGVTGAGREPGRTTHFPECADSLSAYKVGCHRHTPEISRNISRMAGRDIPLIFTPHLAPMNRGILSTIYVPLGDSGGGRMFSAVGRPSAVRPPDKSIDKKADEFRRLYEEFYGTEPFVRVLPAGCAAATNRVRQSNYCDISLHLDQCGSTLIIITAIDNMVKGAAGQAVQNMNIISGFGETEGLTAIPSAI